MKETSNVLIIRQCSLLYIYFYITNVSKYLSLLSENKERYLYYHYIKVVRFSVDPLPSFFELTYMMLQNNCIDNGVTNGLK